MKKDFLLPSFSSEGSYPSEENPVRSTPQSGSILVEAIVMIGLISALTPVLYKHVSDRRSEVEDINKANTFLLIQRETERYLKENRGNVASGLLPLSNIGLSRLDSKYVIGIRKEEDGDVYAMIAEREASNGGNDMKAGKVASLIGVSAGIYSAINSANAYGINGVWIEKLSDYNLNDIPTGSVVVTTQYNQERQKFYTSDIFADTDFNMGNHSLSATNMTANKFCIKDKCVEDWQDFSLLDLDVVDGCNAGLNTYCQIGYERGINLTCSQIQAVYDKAQIVPVDEYFSLTYGSGKTYQGYKRAKCMADNLIIDNISSGSFRRGVGAIGDSTYSVPKDGWYQITLKGGGGTAGNSSLPYLAAGGILIADKYYNVDTMLTVKGISNACSDSGVGVGVWEGSSDAPVLAAGGGSQWGCAGGGYAAGWSTALYSTGHNWKGERSLSANPASNKNECVSFPCPYGAMGGHGSGGWGGTGYCGNGYTCKAIAGGLQVAANTAYSAASYGNWAGSSTNGWGYASIVYCGNSKSDCPIACDSDDDCPIAKPYCDFTEGRCALAMCPEVGSTVFAVTEGSFPWYNNVANVPPDIAYASPYFRLYSYITECAGKYKIELRGQGRINHDYPWNAAGGIAKGEKYYAKGETLGIITLSGASVSHVNGGIGIGLLAGATVQLMAGGNGGIRFMSNNLASGGGGLRGGWAYAPNNGTPLIVRYGYGYANDLAYQNNKGVYKTLSSAGVGNAQGGGAIYGGLSGYGGSGTTLSDCIGKGFTNCSIVAGGNSDWYHNGTNYLASQYGNIGDASVTITYCGPLESSTCP